MHWLKKVFKPLGNIASFDLVLLRARALRAPVFLGSLTRKRQTERVKKASLMLIMAVQGLRLEDQRGGGAAGQPQHHRLQPGVPPGL